ncbi:hypothetical protein H8744_05980 [Oscillospiraceae bacterium N12]|uniref:Uncharacterized protein n=1 Tax=Jilunia laotingensis TaxID=2763675 RepID=A0A926F6B0_9BACT|nr:hypothetical protein [Jilunia laotingensis]MBC8592807.1 hypothetical protein [Jilunia laotingensis]
MKLFSYKLFIGLIILSFCCSAIKDSDNNANLRNEAIIIAIEDFLDNCSLQKTDNAFEANVYIENDDILVLGISGTYGFKIYPSSKDTIGAETRIFPSHYIERNNKLIYYWVDSINVLTEEIVKVLAKYNQIDSSYVNYENAYPDYLLDESIKGAHYYFCKNDLSIYKRVVTRVGIGWYDPPKLNCYKKKKKR